MATRIQVPALAGEIVKHQADFYVLSNEDAQAAILKPSEFIACACGAWTKYIEAQKTEGYLRLISGEETLLLDPTDGTQSIGHCGAVFDGWIDPNFKNWGLNTGRNLATEETVLQVHEMIKDGTFEKNYRSLGGNLDELCFTQSQIIQFCQKHRNLLRTDGYGTFFLFKVDTEFFVADVRFGSVGLNVNVRRFSNDCVWNADYRHRFVVPQLNLGN
jgi:hypothetical protein